MVYKVDLNCDMGESFGVYKLGRDEEILDYVTSANIACGFHAGDPATMRRRVRVLRRRTRSGVRPDPGREAAPRVAPRRQWPRGDRGGTRGVRGGRGTDGQHAVTPR